MIEIKILLTTEQKALLEHGSVSTTNGLKTYFGDFPYNFVENPDGSFTLINKK